jgi:peptidoglycan/xylan/chitin deacetylase (PgdA/CDA1 family)
MRRRSFLVTAAMVTLLPSGCAWRQEEWRRPDIVGGNNITFEPGDRAGRSDATPGEDAEDVAADDSGSTGEPPELDPADYSTSASEWGERVTGVRTRLDTDDQVIALTLDACGGPNAIGFDEDLVGFLVAEQIPATLFLNKRWIDANEDLVVQLAGEPLFELANHGTEHRPLSIGGRSAYGLTGTADPAGVIEEVVINQRTITDLTGQVPAYFRSGTAHYDEVAVQIVHDLGLEVVGFDVLGDAGATFNAAQVAAAFDAAQPGSIALLHMNHPAGQTAEGVRAAVPALRERGFSFVRLSDYPLAA